MTYRHTGPMGFEFSGNRARCSELVGPARLLAQRALDAIEAMGGSGMRVEQQRLPDGATIRVVAIRNFDTPLIRAHLYAPSGKLEAVWTVRLVDYDSGVITNPIILSERIVGRIQTEQGAARVPAEQSLERHAIPLLGEFATYLDMESGQAWSQHRRIRPGFYTGYMRQLVQWLLGIGIAQRASLDARVPGHVLASQKERSEWPDTFGLWSRNAEAAEMEIRYDYHFDCTHGIVFTDTGQCCVMQIGRTGVYVWPLAVDPVSQVPKVRERYKLLFPELFEEDLSGLGLFDLFGGVPTGEQPPTEGEIETLVKAGDVACLLTEEEMGKFYAQNAAYYDTQGWAFAPLTAMAANTCWGWKDFDEADPDNPGPPTRRGHLFYLSWYLESWIEPAATAETAEIRARFPDRTPWRLRKINRLDGAQAATVLGWLDSQSFTLEAFDAIEVESPLTGAAVLERQKSGPICHSKPFAHMTDCMEPTGHPQFKTPDEQTGKLFSFNFELPDPTPGDAPIWVCWVREQLLVISYSYRGPASGGEEMVDSREPCQIVGSWGIERKAVKQPLGSFYCRAFDFRKNIQTSGMFLSKITSNPNGTYDRMEFTDYFATCSRMQRHVVTSRISDTYQDDGGYWRDSLVVPFGDRSIVYTATLNERWQGFRVHSVTPWFHNGTTGYTRHGYVYHFVCHWFGGGCDWTKQVQNVKCVMTEMHPMDFNPWTCPSMKAYGPPEMMEYRPCYDSQHNQIGQCIYEWNYNDSTNRDGEAYERSDPAKDSAEWEVQIWGDTAFSGKKLMGGSRKEAKIELAGLPVSIWWWLSSPACDQGLAPYAEVSVNRWGSPLMNAHEQIGLPPPSTIKHEGAPLNLHVGPDGVFYGYVSPEVVDYG